jgi:4-amino-4-deoxy-L-arabinose transferase-like glycosyltransferase
VLTRGQRIFLFLLFAFAICFLYLYNLDGTGVLQPDEPRYASIGRDMARSGDWVTPRLWGKPWFEKPALVFWLAALGTVAGLNPDLAGRLPVALLSLLFLCAWFFLLRAEFGTYAAAVASLLLATSAEWLAYSSLCLTDVPLSIGFSLAVGLALRIMRKREARWEWPLLGCGLGFAILAKGLVPIILALPLAWFLRRDWRRWWIAILSALIVAGPWYALVIARNGYPFIQEFFLKQHFARLYSNSLQHVQPAYFYLPVLLGALFPWTPLLLVVRRSVLRDERAQCLLITALFGLLFFSVSLNKLPGYILPLVPLVFALVGIACQTRRLFEPARGLLVSCAFLIATIPLVTEILPELLSVKIASVHQLLIAVLPVTMGMLVLFFTPLVVAGVANRRVAGALLVLCCAVAGIHLRASAYPVLDRVASPRGLWRQISSEIPKVCDGGLHRAWSYGLAFYNGMPLPPCGTGTYPIHLVQTGSERPVIRHVGP